jgi:hypothetical protein
MPKAQGQVGIIAINYLAVPDRQVSPRLAFSAIFGSFPDGCYRGFTTLVSQGLFLEGSRRSDTCICHFLVAFYLASLRQQLVSLYYTAA